MDAPRHPVGWRRLAPFVAGVVLLGGACSNAAESGLENLIEEQGGGDVDLDLDGDGGFSIETEDGSMSIDEDGNFVVTDENGDTITGQADEDGGVNIESEDGSFTSGSTTELPDQWPAEIPQPDGLAIESATVIGSEDDQSITVSGTAQSADFVDDYAMQLESAGFTQESTFESDGTVNRVYVNNPWTVGVVYFGDGDRTTISVFAGA